MRRYHSFIFVFHLAICDEAVRLGMARLPENPDEVVAARLQSALVIEHVRVGGRQCRVPIERLAVRGDRGLQVSPLFQHDAKGEVTLSHSAVVGREVAWAAASAP